MFANLFCSGKFDVVSVTFADFDGALYHVSNPDGDRSKLMVCAAETLLFFIFSV